jgi:hypothetical protein
MSSSVILASAVSMCRGKRHTDTFITLPSNDTFVNRDSFGRGSIGGNQTFALQRLAPVHAILSSCCGSLARDDTFQLDGSLGLHDTFALCGSLNSFSFDLLLDLTTA